MSTVAVVAIGGALVLAAGAAMTLGRARRKRERLTADALRDACFACGGFDLAGDGETYRCGSCGFDSRTLAKAQLKPLVEWFRSLGLARMVLLETRVGEDRAKADSWFDAAIHSVAKTRNLTQSYGSTGLKAVDLTEGLTRSWNRGVDIVREVRDAAAGSLQADLLAPLEPAGPLPPDSTDPASSWRPSPLITIDYHRGRCEALLLAIDRCRAMLAVELDADPLVVVPGLERLAGVSSS